MATSNQTNVEVPCLGSSFEENFTTDIEMQDLSMDIIDHLTEKKETCSFDSSCHYIVVDTNILISELHLITELKDKPLDGFGPPHFFIPWIVIEELDKLKSQRAVSKAACREAAYEAIRYLNSVLRNHPRFRGQTPAEAEEWAKKYSKCNDDKILECCIALKDKMPPEKVTLLTNDLNLVNKALIWNINVHNCKNIMKTGKPDTAFIRKEINSRKRKKSKNSSEVSAEHCLISKRDSSKNEIHSIMSNTRLLFVNTLFQLFGEGMNEACGDGLKFYSDAKLFEECLYEIKKKLWQSGLPQFLSQNDKIHFELLLVKATRPEGFMGDKDECLVIFSTIEGIFCQIQRHRPTLKVPVKAIGEYRVACVNAFTSISDAESSIRAVEEKSVREILDRNWGAINQLCGIILDYYGVPHDFDYNKLNHSLPESEIRRIMSDFYPGVQTIRNLFKSVYDSIQKEQIAKSSTKKLATALLNFIPSLKLTCDPLSYPLFSPKSLHNFLTCPQNRQTLEVGIKQIEKFYSKLDEGLNVMLKQRSSKSSQETESMISD